MRLIRSIARITGFERGCVATIGNFDGVHRGHAHVLTQLVQQAKQRGLPSVVILFEPQPKEFFQPAEAPPRLSNLREKLTLLSSFQIDYVVRLSFNTHLSEMPASTFIKSVLMDRLNVQQFMIGKDFRFGHRRQGDVHTLREASEQYGFTLTCLPDFNESDARVSSSRIREALASAEFEEAARCLGYAYFMMGRVVHGNKLGAALGCPTANIQPRRLMTAVRGIFIVHVHGVESHPLPGVASVGWRPTVGGSHLLLEAHLLDRHDDLYGRVLRVEFIKKIRDEVVFESLDALKDAIAGDLVVARDFFCHSERSEDSLSEFL